MGEGQSLEVYSKSFPPQQFLDVEFENQVHFFAILTTQKNERGKKGSILELLRFG